MKNISTLSPYTTWPTLSSEARQVAVRPGVTQPSDRDRSHRTFVDADIDPDSGQKHGQKTDNRTGFSSRSGDSSQDHQHRSLSVGEESPARLPYPSMPEATIPAPSGIETLVSAQQFGQSAARAPLSAPVYQNHIAAYDQSERLSPGPDSSPQILEPSADGEESEVEFSRRIDFSV